MTNYPTKYKFTSIDFFVNDLEVTTTRKTAGIYDLSAKVGGLASGLMLFLNGIVLLFANGPCLKYMQYTPLSASQLYRWKVPQSFANGKLMKGV